MKNKFKWIMIFLSTLVVAYLIVALNITTIQSWIFYFSHKHPTTWNDIQINYPIGTHYKIYPQKEKIQFTYYSMHYPGAVSISKKQYSSFDDVIYKFNNNPIFNNIIFSHVNFKKEKMLFVEATMIEKNQYTAKLYCSPQRGVVFGYIGPIDNYSKFKSIIESITFLYKPLSKHVAEDKDNVSINAKFESYLSDLKSLPKFSNFKWGNATIIYNDDVLYKTKGNRLFLYYNPEKYLAFVTVENVETDLFPIKEIKSNLDKTDNYLKTEITTFDGRESVYTESIDPDSKYFNAVYLIPKAKLMIGYTGPQRHFEALSKIFDLIHIASPKKE